MSDVFDALAARGGGKCATESHGTVFVKVGTGGARASVPALKYESAGLELLGSVVRQFSVPLVVPKPIHVGHLKGPGAFIVVEYVEMARSPVLGSKLGQALALLHKAPAHSKQFGFLLDGCCGNCPQLNNSQRRDLNWVEFWREFRLGAQLDELRKRYPSDVAVQELGAQVSKHLDDYFGGAGLIVSDIQPSLLHGDLWSGNAGFATEANSPCIFDPACYFGHSEADLGIMSMFGPPGGTTFWDSYHSTMGERAPGFEKRAVLYEMHHHMNHYNMFGSGYRSGVIQLMQKLLKR